jgi:serine/threonine protein kinase/tetratricopeptide (TPR) repeat protein
MGHPVAAMGATRWRRLIFSDSLAGFLNRRGINDWSGNPMNGAQPVAKAIFLDALECASPEELTRFIDQACAGDCDLRRRVEELLHAHREAGNFLGSVPIEAGSPDELASAYVGTKIGPYKLLQQIGEGGFGIVFMAEQLEPIQRKVALKIIKPGMDTRQVIARFEAERQALALMDHPNIAKVLDAGTISGVEVGQAPPDNIAGQLSSQAQPDLSSGRFYFVMELVKGVPITQYCDQKQLTLRRRLELFVPVCQALQHAHQKGIIHRDLKPSNVMIAEYDERPVAKIIDFGVAKAIGQRLTAKTMFTEFGQIIGTVEYMSPEQAKLNQLDIDTRSDIYSLGVLLYELLTGLTPFDREQLRAVAFDEMLRMIREAEPQSPSTRASTLAQAALSTVCEARGIAPAELCQRLRGELDWIVMKCLDKDRDCRYQTSDSLARDIERYLADEPVLACPPSARYRIRKFARRNRVVLIAGSLVTAALIVGTTASALWAMRAIDAERSADDARTKAEASFQKARQAVDDMYTQVAERWLAHQPQMEPVQRQFLEKALQFYTNFASQTGSEPSVRFETARAYRRIAEIQHRLGQPAQAEDAFRQAIQYTQALANEFPSESAYRVELTASLHKLGVLFGDTGRSDEEEKVHRRALAIDEALLAEAPRAAAYRRDAGRGHWYLGQALLALQRYPEANRELRSALVVQQELVREFPTNPEYRHHLAQSHLRLGLTLRNLGRFEEYHEALVTAAELLQSVVAEFPTLPDYRNELANAYFWQVHYCRERGLSPDQALHYLTRALELQDELLAQYPSVTDYRYDWFRSQRELGRTLMEANRFDEAESALRQAANVGQKLAADAPQVPYYRDGLAQVNILQGDLLAAAGRLNEAESPYRAAIRLFSALVAERPNVPQHQLGLTQSREKLAAILQAAGDPSKSWEPSPNAERAKDESPPFDTVGVEFWNSTNDLKTRKDAPADSVSDKK